MTKLADTQAQADTKKLSVLMTVYNESDFVDYAIRACQPYVDNLIIVEGAYQETIALGAEPRSTDGTRLTLSKLSLDIRRDAIIEANEQTDKDQRNVGLEKIKELNPDGWLLIIDGDEVYTKENFEIIRNFMYLMDKQNKKAAYFKSLTFVNDAKTYCEQEFPRLFKISQNCSFFSDNYMTWEGKGDDWSLKNIIKLPYLRYHHYAFCKSKDKKRFQLKKDWWESRFPDERNFEYDWYVNEEGKIWSPNHKLLRYTGKHPEIMKDHPLLKNESL